jgi:hypothetical protein
MGLPPPVNKSCAPNHFWITLAGSMASARDASNLNLGLARLIIVCYPGQRTKVGNGTPPRRDLAEIEGRFVGTVRVERPAPVTELV